MVNIQSIRLLTCKPKLQDKMQCYKPKYTKNNKTQKIEAEREM